MWALDSAVRDQFQTLRAVEAGVLPGTPRQVLAVGTSMGGLISALEAQDGAGRVDGALTTCGIVAGAVNLNNYQLDGEYALAQLLLPGQQVQLVRFASAADALTTAGILQTAAAQAQQTPGGRARLALAMAFINVPPRPARPSRLRPATRPRGRPPSTRWSSPARSPPSTSSRADGPRSTRPRAAAAPGPAAWTSPPSWTIRRTCGRSRRCTARPGSGCAAT